MKSKCAYASYKNYMVKFDPDTLTLNFTHSATRSRATFTLQGLYENGVLAQKMADFERCVTRTNLRRDEHELVVAFGTDNRALPQPELHIYVNSKGIRLTFYSMGQYDVYCSGDIAHGENEDSFPINLGDTTSEIIHAGIGPASSKYDNALYNKKEDTALVLECRKTRIKYNWEKKCYDLSFSTKSEGVVEEICFFVKKNILADKYDIEFSPLKKRGRYDAPPAGWMTWYSVKFGAGEEAVLRNTAFQEKHLKDFGADTVWVDWEWCHQRYERERFDGVDNFHPDPKKYPNGLQVVSKAIKEAGFTPALWIGYTNDIGFTDYEREHPEISLSHHETWSGLYYYDISHPEFLNGYLKKAVAQVKDWGYEAVKFDTLPNCVTAHEQHHANMHDPDLTTFEAYRAMIKKTREYLGEDYYMLSCGGSYDSVILSGVGVFDAARVGPDLFEWKKFVENLGRVRTFYPLHNIALINDSDNIVLRDEYSTLSQAKTRVSLVSLLGLPLTLGDDLPTLPDERFDLIRRALPVMKVHPTDFNQAISDNMTQTIVLHIATPFEDYKVVGVLNLTDGEKKRYISIGEDLRAEEGKYHVFDFFENKYLGIFDDRFAVKAEPYNTKLLAVRRVTGTPQIISTSRHITQGAAEIKEMAWRDDTLSFTSSLVKDDQYRVKIFVPEGYSLISSTLGETALEENILTLTYTPDKTGDESFTLNFKKGN